MPQYYDPWPVWIQQGTGYGTTAATTIWNGWVSTSSNVMPQTGTVLTNPWDWQTTGAAVVQNTIWIDWVNQPQIRPALPGGWQAPPPVELTAEQKADRARRKLIAVNRGRADLLRRKIAARKANQLLLDFLDETQRAEWVKDRAFHVHTADGLRTYRVAYGLAGNVRLVKADGKTLDKHGRLLRPGSRFCAHVYHPDGQVPHEDNVLTQKLLLEANEAEFLAMANVS